MSFRKRRGVAECPIAAIPAIAATRIERGGDAKSSILRPIGPGGSAEELNMRAAFITGYGDNSVVGCGEIADPTPGADEALIEVRAAGTNPVEISMREGHFKATLPFSFPQVMGYDNPLPRVSEAMPSESKRTAISRRQALTLVAGVAAFVSGAHVTAQTSPSGGLPTTEPSRVERAQAELDNNRRKTMSQTASTLLLRNLHDVFGEIDPVRRRAAIDEIFHEDAVFYEPNGAYRGRDEIDRIAGVIKATHPDFQYQPLSPPVWSGWMRALEPASRSKAATHRQAS